MIYIFTIATEQISNILSELPEKVELRNGYATIDLVEFISQCSQILESFQNELLVSNPSDKKDFYTETAYTIF